MPGSSCGVAPAGSCGRGDRIRTYDLLVPNQALYQTKLHPVHKGRRARSFSASVNFIHEGKTADIPSGFVSNLCLPSPGNALLLRFSPTLMDTISRENNSMLPIGGIIVGVVALLLGGYAAMTLSKLNKTVAAQEEKLAKIESIELQVTGAVDTAAKANRAIADYARQTQDGFNTVGNELAKMREEMTRAAEAKKPVAGTARKSNEPVVAGPGEYVVKVGDSSGTKIATANGVSIADLKAVNPGVDWNSLKVGQKLKLPAK